MWGLLIHQSIGPSLQNKANTPMTINDLTIQARSQPITALRFFHGPIKKFLTKNLKKNQHDCCEEVFTDTPYQRQYSNTVPED